MQWVLSPVPEMWNKVSSLLSLSASAHLLINYSSKFAYPGGLARKHWIQCLQTSFRGHFPFQHQHDRLMLKWFQVEVRKFILRTPINPFPNSFSSFPFFYCLLRPIHPAFHSPPSLCVCKCVHACAYGHTCVHVYACVCVCMHTCTTCVFWIIWDLEKASLVYILS